MSTTVKENADGPGTCLNGNPEVNCNTYQAKENVWLSGLPASADLGAGKYFFSVMVPGSQHDPNDGSAGNLSSPHDGYLDRTFEVDADGIISYGGSHEFDSNLIRLADYDSTTNNGGVYILAVCKYGTADENAQHAPGVDPKDCKYDMFKVPDGSTVVAAGLPGVSKDAAGTFDTTWTWGSLDKSVNKTFVKQAGGPASFTYTVKVSHDAGTDSNWKVDGSITVDHSEKLSDGTSVPIVVDVADQLSNSGTPCWTRDDLVVVGTRTVSYSCSLDSAPAAGLTNTATISWDEQLLDNGHHLAASSTSSEAVPVAFTRDNAIGACVTVSDTFNGGSAANLGTVCQNNTPAADLATGVTLVGYTSPTFTLSYDRSIAVQPGCRTYDNTAAIPGMTDGASVRVCGEVGGRTIGFWQNNNGQALIKNSGSTGGVCNTAIALTMYNPYKDMTAAQKADCVKTAAYVYDIVKKANASGAAMNAMLKAQMMATVLSVRLTGGAALGAFVVDLTKVCKDFTTCATTQNVSAAFNGATSLTVNQMLAYSSSRSNSGGSQWYLVGGVNNKPLQELAKNAYDAINNNMVIAG